MFNSLKRHYKIIIVSTIAMMPAVFAQTSNMTSEMLEMLVEIMPIMVVVMVIRVMAGSFQQ